MLEAANADLVPPSAWSAAPKISSDLHAGRPITPSVTPIATDFCGAAKLRYVP